MLKKVKTNGIHKASYDNLTTILKVDLSCKKATLKCNDNLLDKAPLHIRPWPIWSFGWDVP